MDSELRAVSLGRKPNIEDSRSLSFWSGAFTKNCIIHGWVSNHERDRGPAIRMLSKYINNSDGAWDKVSLEKYNVNSFESTMQGQHKFWPPLYMPLIYMHNSLKSVLLSHTMSKVPH